MTRSSAPAVLLLTAGCVSFDDGTATATVYWSGTVLDDPYLGTDPVALDGGSVVAVDLDDAEVAAGLASESSVGSFTLEVPADTEVALRVSGPSHAPTVWRSRTPTQRALWLTGALFARQTEPLDAFLGDLAEPAAPLAGGTVTHLWVEPLDPAALADATVQLVDGEGQPGRVLALTTAEDGALVAAGAGDPVDLLLGLDLAPGPVTLAVEATDGRAAEVTWPARGGDLLAGLFFTLGSE